MSVSLETFTLIVDSVLAYSTAFFTMAQGAVLIDEPQVTLFSIMIGFTVLELFLWAIFLFRPQKGVLNK